MNLDRLRPDTSAFWVLASEPSVTADGVGSLGLGYYMSPPPPKFWVSLLPVHLNSRPSGRVLGSLWMSAALGAKSCVCIRSSRSGAKSCVCIRSCFSLLCSLAAPLLGNTQLHYPLLFRVTASNAPTCWALTPSARTGAFQTTSTFSSPRSH